MNKKIRSYFYSQK